MHVNLDPRNALHVARQPILDLSQRVFAYELLYRDTASSAGSDTSDMTAARVLSDSLLALGLDTLTGGLPAFVSVTRGLLVTLASCVLPPRGTVLQLPGESDLDQELIDACGALRAKGYTLALDDVVPRSAAVRLLPYATFVKVDVLATSTDTRLELVRQLQPRGLHLIAKHVETAEIAQEVQAAGYAFVQGHFFCRPRTFSSKPVSARRVVYLRLLAALNRRNVSIDDVEDLVKRDASMSLRVLRCINSAAFGVQREIHSIRQAITLLGLDQVRRWASIWAIAGINEGGTLELATTAIVRARCCELLAKNINDVDSGDYFLLGLCSLLDTMLGQPMERAIADLPVSAEVRQALLGKRCFAQSVLDAVVGYERGAWNDAAVALQTTRLDPAVLRDVYTESLRWTRQLSRDSVAA